MRDPMWSLVEVTRAERSSEEAGRDAHAKRSSHATSPEVPSPSKTRHSGQAISVHPQPLGPHVQVLQPSSEGLLVPSEPTVPSVSAQVPSVT